MRIIAGSMRGRKLYSPTTSVTRPTSDRTRESIFNILSHLMGKNQQTFSDYYVLDLFAGTGALGLEALSRGCQKAVFVEKNAETFQCLKNNIITLKVDTHAQILCQDAFLPLITLHSTTCSEHKVSPRFSLIFLDPPYGQEFVRTALKHLEHHSYMAPQGLIVCEIGPNDAFVLKGPFSIIQERHFLHCKIFILMYHPA